MAKKYGIDFGHNGNLNGVIDSGAVGIRKEADLTVEVGKALIAKLNAAGNTTVVCTPDRSIKFTGQNYIGQNLEYRCKKANDAKVDTFVCIHFNADNGAGKGTEVWYLSDQSKILANSILPKIAALGYQSRGIKKAGVDGKNLYVLQHTTMPAVLIECAFIDNVEDMKRYNADKLANAIFEGLTGKPFIAAPAATTVKTPLTIAKAPATVPNIDVKKLQTYLNLAGYRDINNKPLVVDGILGANTKFAASQLHIDISKF